ncbi:SYNE1 [Mytilus coruscus]|uniref:SYNE1 n=1 Tax=Mytilus coruscus TaxID=42192 RepID=A0A6J8EAL5_MYTCO|nr:SYNE1 [Mytilus coruscus]
MINSIFLFQLTARLAFLALGLYIKFQKHTYISLLGSSTFPLATYLLLGTGAFIILSGIICCTGTCIENRCFMVMIEDTFAQNYETGEQAPLSAIDMFRKNAKKALLAWTANAITKKYGIEVNNFGKSWRDGLAFNAMVHTINPDLVDFDQGWKQDARTNLEQAFSDAESQLCIARQLDPEDVDVEKPDEKSLSKRKNPAKQEISDYNDLLTWIKEETDEVLQIVDQPVTDSQAEYKDFIAFKTEFDRQQKIFQRLEEKVVSKKAVKITPKMWQELEPKWRDIARRTRMWLWKLDASLPGCPGKFGDWLNQAEEMLEIEPENQLAGFSAATEEKVKIWLSKLGTQEDVEEMVLDYKDFVQTNNLFANYDKMLRETKKRGDAFRKHVSKEEAAQITQFADEKTQKWKTMSAEIKSLQSMFDEGLEQWKRYNGCYNMVIAWFTEGEQVMHGGTKEQIEEYFTEIPHRFTELVEGYQHYKKVEVIGKGRQEYQLGVDRISEWLQNAEEFLATEPYNKRISRVRNTRTYKINIRISSGQLLEDNLEELLKDSPETDADEERRKLWDLIGQFVSIQPGMESVTDKSAVFSKAYHFRDELHKRSDWLDEAQRLVNEDPFIDGLEDA